MSMVQTDLAGNCHTADTGAFLDSIFPLPPQTVEEIYQIMESDKLYTYGSWKGLPTVEKREKDLYTPFAAIANAINLGCASCSSDMCIKTYWLDRHNTSPRSRDEYAAAIRPDIVCTLGTAEALDDWEKNMAVLKESVGKPEGARVEESKDILQKVRCVYAAQTCSLPTP